MVLLNFFKYWMKNNFSTFFRLDEETLKMACWKYNDKYYFKNNDKTLLNTELLYQMKSTNAKLSYLVLHKICLTLWV